MPTLTHAHVTCAENSVSTVAFRGLELSREIKRVFLGNQKALRLVVFGTDLFLHLGFLSFLLNGRDEARKL